MNWKALLESLAVAAIGGAATGGAHALSEGTANPKAIGASAGAGALLAVAALFRHVPTEPKPEPRPRQRKEASKSGAK